MFGLSFSDSDPSRLMELAAEDIVLFGTEGPYAVVKIERRVVPLIRMRYITIVTGLHTILSEMNTYMMRQAKPIAQSAGAAD